jgi:uncharacterized membrane protein YphA (DoxX/SURF4 family)
MNNPGPTQTRSALGWLALIARIALGGFFIYMGLVKAAHPDHFLKLIRQYDIVTSPMVLNSIAAILPWFEVFCGLLLVIGIAVRGSALMLVCMLVPFTLIVLRRALAIHASQGTGFCLIKFDCGCGAGEVFICNKLVENSLLLLVSLAFLIGFGRRSSATSTPAKEVL